jgi:hypothetical protein
VKFCTNNDILLTIFHEEKSFTDELSKDTSGRKSLLGPIKYLFREKEERKAQIMTTFCFPFFLIFILCIVGLVRPNVM